MDASSLDEAADSALERVNSRRVQILEAAARVISERGADGTRLADVARAAGVSIGLIQHYFSSRNELLAAAFDYFNDLWMQDWSAAAAAASDPPGKLWTLLRFSSFEFEGWHEVQWRIWVEFWSLCNRDQRFRAQYPDVYDTFRKPFREAIVEGIETGYFSPRSTVDDALDRLTAQIEGLRVHALLEPDRVSRERMFKLLLGTAERELRFSLAAEDLACGR